MDKLKMHSPDLSQANIEKIQSLFPYCVTEVQGEQGNIKLAVDFDLLKQELSDSIVEGPQERYHLNWPGKRDALLTANAPIAKTLRPCREKSVKFSTSKNLFIEGDNLDALKLLQESYLNRVKTIFIDPPYNTGNDFIYHDDFADSADSYITRSNQLDSYGNRLQTNTESNGRFHSDWLSMLYPRLKLSRNMLREDGAIFIAIDNNEAANLQLVLDEVFGATNFVTQIIWQKRVSPANDAKWFSSDHDQIFVYAKNKEKWRPNKLERTANQLSYYKNPDNDPKGAWNSATYTCNKSKDERPNLYYPIVNPNTGEEIWPKETAVWKYGKDVTDKYLVEGKLYWGANGRSTSPRVKLYLSEMDNVVPRTVWSSEEAGSTQSATAELKKLFGGKGVFDSPKPVKLLERILEVSCSTSDDIVMDFFGGSGTTAHAAMKRAAIGKAGPFILVQISEEAKKGEYANISDVTRERLLRAGKELLDEFGEEVDVGFRKLNITTSNMENVYYKPDATNQADMFAQVQNIKDDRTDEDLLFQVLLDWGVGLTLPISKQPISSKDVFFVNADDTGESADLIACFASDISNELIKTIAEKQPLRVVFRDDGFATDAVKINVEQIFKQISPITDVKSI